ncbi:MULTISPECIES: TetR/AcrR family transcriptional regulator [unclassified Streptomyces]|uniref:TetR/AcrR family transcriptional regulator n=1 Tax=unclassified Streptomyces TaxID=2593676 RepID=UPI003D718429
MSAEPPAVPSLDASRRPYHHGDLRRAILSAALDVIAADGPSALSLRDLARRAGVSHAAPAHHFKDRTGLLTAIAAEGHGLLAQTIAQATDLRDAGVRYVRFARRHPAHFQVMFAPELLRADDLELITARALSAAALTDAIAARDSDGSTSPDAGLGREADSVPGHEPGSVPGADHAGSPADPRLSRVAVWSLAHGFATLLLSHNLDTLIGEDDPEDVLRALPFTLFPAR